MNIVNLFLLESILIIISVILIVPLKDMIIMAPLISVVSVIMLFKIYNCILMSPRMLTKQSDSKHTQL